MKRYFCITAAAFLLISCAGGRCGKKEPSTGGADVFVWNNGSEPPTLDVGITTDTASGNIVIQLFEGLTEYEPKTLKPIPGVATHWEVSPDGKIYTFHLRNNAKWSNGDPVTAHDFEYSWKRVLNPETASEYAYIFYFIKGAEDYNKGRNKNSASVAVKAIDPLKLQVELKNPTPFFDQLVTFQVYRPVHKKTVEEWKNQWTLPEHIVTNGPYKMISWIPHKEILLEKNPHYWDQANVKIPKVKFLPIEDRETALKLCLVGEAHYCEDLPFLKMASLRKEPGFQEKTYLSVYFYLINTTKKALNDRRVRQALNLALDKKKIVEVMQKRELPATHFVPPGVKDYISPAGEEFNPVKARQLLEEAGFKDPKTFPKFSIIYNTSENHKAIAELVQNMWKSNLGIDVDIQNQEWKILLNNYNTSNYDIGRYGWVGDYVDPFTFLDIFTTSSTINRTGWSHKEYDDLVLNQSAKEQNPAKRDQILKKAETILLEELPGIPIYFYNRPVLLDPRVKGFYLNLKDEHPLKFAYFQDK